MTGQLENLKALTRARFNRLTATRLGMIAGEEGIEILNPYPEGSRGHQSYKEGFEFGQQQAKRKANPDYIEIPDFLRRN